MVDVRLQSDDGTVFRCHKCVLVARLEYFEHMFGGFGWVEVILIMYYNLIYCRRSSTQALTQVTSDRRNDA